MYSDHVCCKLVEVARHCRKGGGRGGAKLPREPTDLETYICALAPASLKIDKTEFKNQLMGMDAHEYACLAECLPFCWNAILLQISPFAGNMSLRQLIAEFASDARRDSIVIAKYPSDWGATATTVNRFRPLSCAMCRVVSRWADSADRLSVGRLSLRSMLELYEKVPRPAA
jgi:hypothetical protein